MKLRNTSASQVEAWSSCPRAWHFGWVKGFKSPPTEAMQRGTLIHAAIEATIKTGVVPATEWGVYAQAALPHLPMGQREVLVEHKMVLDTAPGLPPWVGYIDLLDDSRALSQVLRITDHKTTSDFRYAKTPEELACNPQVISYARFAFAEIVDPEEQYVEVGHLYIKTAKKPPKVATVLPVFTQVDRVQVDKIWERDLTLVEEMVRAAEIDNTDKLPPKGTTNGHCEKYGGCPHKARCGIVKNLTPKESVTMSNEFLKRLEAARAAKASGQAPAPAPAPARADADEAAPRGASERADAARAALPVAATASVGVLPPDAPARTTPVAPPASTLAAGAVAPAAEPKRRGRPPKAAEAIVAQEPAAALVAPPAPAPAAPRAAQPHAEGAGMALYIDCTPTKHGDDVFPSLFEDWFNPALMVLNEQAQARGLPDYRLLPFGEKQVMFSLAVADQLRRNMPMALVVSTSSLNGKDALDVLIPNATTVVRRL